MLETICGGRTNDGANQLEVAFLFLDDGNPYDENAVRVEICDQTVGYLDRKDAKAYRQFLQERGHTRIDGVCGAQIRGGWKRPRSEGTSESG